MLESETYDGMPPIEWSTVDTEKEDHKDEDYVDENIENTSDDEKGEEQLKPKIKKENNKTNKTKGRRKKKSNDISSEMFTCDICSKRFCKLHRLEGHLRQHRGLKVRLMILFNMIWIFTKSYSNTKLLMLSINIPL